MSKLIRHTQKRGTALFVALSLTALTFLSLVSFVGGPAVPRWRDSGRDTNERACSRRRLAPTRKDRPDTAQPQTAQPPNGSRQSRPA